MAFSLKSRTDKGKLVVHLLVVSFGITSWSILNGLWVELPILVAHLPEGWTLPSYLTIISQFGNIGPIAFSFLVYLTPNRKLETPACFVIVTALTLCALLYSFFWSHTAIVSGEEFSVALLSLTLCQAVFAATTSIAYLAFMAHLKAQYMGSIFIGMSLSGLIPAFAAIGQGSGDVRCVTNTSILNNNVSSTVSLFYPVNISLPDITREFDEIPEFNSTSKFFANVKSVEWPGDGHSTGPLSDLNNANSTNVQYVHAYNVEPLFSVQGFFLLLTALGGLSVFSLMMLLYHPHCTAEHVDSDLEENCQLMIHESKRQPLALTQIGDKPSISSSVLYDNTNIQLTTNSDVPSNGDITNIASARKDSQSLDVYDGDTLQKSTPYPSTKTACLESSDSARDSLKRDSNSLGVETTISFQSLPTKKSPVDGNRGGLTVGDLQELTAGDENKGTGGDIETENRGTPLSRVESWFLLGLLVWINVIQTSFVLAIQVYSSLPYGLFYYNGVTKAENIVDPIACLLTMWITTKSTRVISGLTLLGTLFSAYIITLAAMSPSPMFMHHAAGGILVIAAWVISTMINVFAKVTIASVMRGQGRISLMWAGGSTQLGALIGAILAYVMVNQLHLFKDSPWCV